jgi:hypothetical protein
MAVWIRLGLAALALLMATACAAETPADSDAEITAKTSQSIKARSSWCKRAFSWPVAWCGGRRGNVPTVGCEEMMLSAPNPKIARRRASACTGGLHCAKGRDAKGRPYATCRY